MKSTLSFNFPTEQDKFNRALRADQMVAVIKYYIDYLNGKMKYEGKTSVDIQEAQQKLFNLITEYNLSDLFKPNA